VEIDRATKAFVATGPELETHRTNRMHTYIAFLRGINVGGNKLIKMQELVRIFSAAGCRNVRTYQQAGNVIFESRSSGRKRLTKKIEAALEAELGYGVPIVVRSLLELQQTIERSPFKKLEKSKNVMLLVVFLAEDPIPKPVLPFVSTTENVEIFEVADGVAFCVARRKKNGWFGFPNGVVEKAFNVVATTRQWSTVQNVIKAAEG
jgi:uncharacterized protein (DUF1697 family)